MIDGQGKLAYIGDFGDTVYAAEKIVTGTWKGQADIDALAEGNAKLKAFRDELFKNHKNLDTWGEKDAKAIRETELPALEKVLNDYPALATDRPGWQTRFMTLLLARDYDKAGDLFVGKVTASGKRRNTTLLNDLVSLFVSSPIAKWKPEPKLSQLVARLTRAVEPWFDATKGTSDENERRGWAVLIGLNRKYGNKEQDEAFTKKLLAAAPENEREKLAAELNKTLKELFREIER